MSSVERPDREPMLLLTHEEFCRVVALVPPRGPAAPQRRPERRSVEWAIVLAILLVVAAGAWFGWRTPPVSAAPAVAARASQAAPVATEARLLTEPPRPVRPAPAPPPATETVPEVDAPPPPPAESRRPWNGGRVWVQVRLRMESRSHAQEADRRETLVWDGSRFILERTSPPDRWRDRLELLLQLPSPDDSWHRHVTATSAETLHLPSGDLPCRRVEGEDRFPQGVRSFRYWYSEEFPPGAIQAEQSLGEITFSCRVLEFGPLPPSPQKP